MSAKLLQIKIRDTQNIVYEGSVDRLSSFNEVGPFDLFPMHANFISIIKHEVALYLKHTKIKELKVEQAVMKVKGDNVHIFLGIETLLVDEEMVDKKKNASVQQQVSPSPKT